MLKISNQSVKFKGKQKSKNIMLTNQLNQPIIYKIKTNNIEAIQAKPNCGFIKPNTSLSLLVKALKLGPFESKIQIIYATIENEDSSQSMHNHNNFQTHWAKIDKNSFKYSLVSVKRIEDDILGSNSSSNDHFFSQNPHQNQNIMKQTPASKNVHFSSAEKSQQKSHMHQSHLGHMKSMKASFTRQNIQIEQKQQSQRQLLIEKSRTSKLRQQLDIAEGKLKQLTDSQIQMKINRSMGIVCEQHHTSFTTLVLIGLFCLVLGFMLGKIG